MATVLIVDDEKSIRLTMTRFIEKAGHEVLAAATPAEAREILSQTPVDVAIVDMLLGAESGIGTAEAVVNCCPNAQVIIITGEPEVTSAREAIRIGAFDYIAKPIGKDTALQVVQRALEEKTRRDDYDKLQASREKQKEELERLVKDRTSDLADSVERFRTLVENLNDVIFEVTKQGRIFYVSSVVEKLLGFSPRDLIGRPFQPFVHPDDLPTVDSAFADVLGGELYPSDFRFQKKNGDYLWVRTSSRPILSPTGNPIGLRGVLTDISHRKSTEERIERLLQQKSSELKRSEERLALTVDGAELGMWDWNVQTGECFYSDRWLAILGHKRNDIAPTVDAWKKLLHPDDKEKTIATLERNLQGEMPLFESEQRLRTESGEWKWVQARGRVVERSSDGKPVRHAGVCFDIDERKYVEKELHKHRTHLEELVTERTERLSNANLRLEKEVEERKHAEDDLVRAQSTAKVGSWTYDVDRDQPSWSAEMFRIFGIAPAEGAPNWQEHRKTIHPDDWDRLDSAVRMAVGKGQPYREEFRIVHPDGSIVWAETRGEVRRDNANRVRELFGTVQDITERNVLEQKLTEAAKGEALGRLCAGISHEYNNIIMGIMGYAHHMRKRLKQDSASYEHCEKIISLADQAKAVSRGLLNFSRGPTGQREKLPLDALIEECVSTFRPLVGEDIRISTDCGSGSHLTANKQQLQEVLVNIMLNACDACPDGGELRIRTSLMGPDDDDPPVHGLDSNASYALIEAHDTGHGMTADTLRRAREPFYTTKPPGSGTGLGLSAAQGIVTAHGGILDIESAEGKGTTVRIYLPTVDE